MTTQCLLYFQLIDTVYLKVLRTRFPFLLCWNG